MQSIDWQKIAPEVAKQLLGEPSSSSSKELRWGNKQSKVLTLESGTWYDFEEDVGGGIIDLIKHLNQDINTVLKQFGYDQALPSDSLLSVSGLPQNNTNKGNARSFTKVQMRELHSQAIVKVQYATNFWVMRFPDGHPIKQKYAPFSMNPDGSWSMRRPEGLLPIYSTNKFPDKPIIINEGEKALRGCEAIRKDGDACTWHGGVNSWNKADWSPIYGRDVWIFPDNDEAGKKVANEISSHLKQNGCSVLIAEPPKEFNEKDDLWDAHESGYFADSKALEDYIKTNTAKRPKGSLYFQTVNEIMANITEPDWLVDRCIERGTVTSIFGAPKTGKSFVAIAMGCAVATGKDFYGYDTKPSTVLYLAGEGTNAVGRRIKAYEQFYSMNLDKKPLLVSNRGSRIGDDEEFAILQQVCRDIEAENNGIGMIIIDTLARNYGLDENSTKDMNTFIQRVDMLKEEFNASIVIVHHTGHGSSARARGSSVLPAALDYEFRVKRSGDDEAMLVSVDQTLVKDGRPIQPLNFKFHEVEVFGFSNVTSGVLKLTLESPKETIIKGARKETIEAIEAYQKEKEPNDPISVWVKYSILLARMDIKDSALKSRLNDLKAHDLVHFKEGYGYQSKSFDNEVF